MKFSVAAVVGVLAAFVNAKAQVTNTGFDVEAGKPFTLTWANATGAVEVQLVAGPEDNLKPVGSPLATGVTTGSFTWTPDKSLATGEYAFEVTDSTGEPNWSKKFSFQGSASASASSSTASSTTSATSMTSTTSTMSTTTMTSNSSTTASSTTKTTSSTTTSSTRSATTTPANTNNGERFSSSLALVLVTIAALICFN